MKARSWSCRLLRFKRYPLSPDCISVGALPRRLLVGPCAGNPTDGAAQPITTLRRPSFTVAQPRSFARPAGRPPVTSCLSICWRTKKTEGPSIITSAVWHDLSPTLDPPGRQVRPRSVAVSISSTFITPDHDATCMTAVPPPRSLRARKGVPFLRRAASSVGLVVVA